MKRYEIRSYGLHSEWEAVISEDGDWADYADVKKLIAENEIHEQCIANIIDTKPGGSIEGQMIAATQMCVRAEQRNEELEAQLAALEIELEEWKGESDANLELAKQTQLMVWEQSAELAALKKDARLLGLDATCQRPDHIDSRDIIDAGFRVLEATKDIA